MARWLALAFGVTVAAVLAVTVGGYVLQERDVVASTPSAYTGGEVPLPLEAGQQACMDQVLFDRDSEVAQFSATAPAGRPGGPFEVSVQDDQGRTLARSPVAAGWSGTQRFRVPLGLGDRELMGRFCVRNTGEERLTLVGQNNDRSRSRPEVRIDDTGTPVELPLTLLRSERSSLLARVPDVLAHASTLKPLGPWFVWLLMAAAFVGVPAALAVALRSAVAADRLDEAPSGRHPASPRAEWPSPRTRALVERVPGWGIVAAGVVLLFAYLLFWGVNTHSFQNDEDQYLYLARYTNDHLPGVLWSFDVYQRGLQRLEIFLLAIPSALLPSPASIVAGRALNTAAFVSTALPAYLLGRGMGLSPRWAALPSVLSIAVPWAVVTTALLTENVAYPAAIWALWAIWRTAVDPSPGRDALALVLLGVCGLARTGLLLLVPLLPAVVLIADLRRADGGVVDRLRATLRAHWLLWTAVVLGALVLLGGAVGLDPTGGIVTRLAGVYGTPFAFTLGPLLAKIGWYFSKSVVGTGILPAAVALPWLFGQLLRPASDRTFAFALTALGGGAILLYGVNSAGFDERYIVYLSPLLFLGATLAMTRREIGAAGLAVASLALAALLLRVPWNGAAGPYGYFVAPADIFYANPIVHRLDTVLPGDVGVPLTLVPLAVAAGGLALALAVRRRGLAGLAGLPAALLVAGTVALVLVQTQYTLSKFVNGAGNRSGPGLAERAFADRNTPAGASLGVFPEGATTEVNVYKSIWQELQFYNQRITTVFTVEGAPVPWAPPSDRVVPVTWDRRTGRLRGAAGLTDYLVVPGLVGELRVRGDVVVASSYMPLSLIRVAKPDTLAWSTDGLGPDATITGDGASVRFFGTGLRPGPHCATIDVGTSGTDGARYEIRRGGRRVAGGEALPAEVTRATLELPGLGGRDHVDVRVTGEGSPRLLAVYVDQFC